MAEVPLVGSLVPQAQTELLAPQVLVEPLIPPPVASTAEAVTMQQVHVQGQVVLPVP